MRYFSLSANVNGVVRDETIQMGGEWDDFVFVFVFGQGKGSLREMEV
jgi:hypothetical protein